MKRTTPPVGIAQTQTAAQVPASAPRPEARSSDQVDLGQQDFPPPDALKAWARTHPVQTVPQLFRQAVSQYGDSPYLGTNVNGTYEYQSYRQIGEQANHFASGLVQLGVQPGERVGILSFNRPEWVVSDMGTLSTGAVNTPLFPSLGAGDIEYALKDSGARVVVAGNADQLKKILSVADNLPDLHTIISMEPTTETSSKQLLNWDDFMKLGADHEARNQPEIESRVKNLKATDTATIVYTSGTTGPAKGTMLMHGNLVSNVTAVKSQVPITQQDVEMSFLPLSHVFERCVSYDVMAGGAKVAYAQGVDTLSKDILAAHPTVVPNVPRVYEKVRDKILEGVAKGPKWQQKVFHWGLGVGQKYAVAQDDGHAPIWLKAEHVAAQKLVYDKIRQNLGGNVRMLVSGGAPLRPDVGTFYSSVGLPIVEGYGLTETSPVVAFNPPDRPKIGTVGKPVPGVDVKIADDGEILVKGPNVMKGYINKPEETAEAIDPQGWYHTGDIGEFDRDGYLKITDRKKNLIVMSTGKKVAPQPIEAELETSPYVQQVVLLGNSEPYITALEVPDFDALRAKGFSGDDATLAADPAVARFLQSENDRLSTDLSDYEKVKKVAVLDHPFTEADGELTALQKIKRPVIMQHFRPEIDALYGHPTA